MHAILRTFRTQWLGAIGILAGITGVAFSATGQPALLGKLNQADKPTIIENTGNGPAVAFKTKPGAPPFSVSSSKKVPNLNAARLGGKLPGAFAAVGDSYTRAEADGLFAPASGSTAYQGARTSQVQYATNFNVAVPPNNVTEIIPNLTVGAPADGRFTVYIFGKASIESGTTLTLDIGGEQAEVTEADTGEFAKEISGAVVAGTKLMITFAGTNTGPAPSFVETVGWLVTFTPE